MLDRGFTDTDKVRCIICHSEPFFEGGEEGEGIGEVGGGGGKEGRGLGEDGVGFGGEVFPFF